MNNGYENLRNNFKKLNLNTIAQIFEQEAKKALTLKSTYTEYLTNLIEAEVFTKTERSIQRKIQNAKFPFVKTMEQFDFAFQPQLDERQIKELMSLSFLERAEGVIFIGPPGVGKTHLAVSIGVKACTARKRVVFFKATKLIETLLSSYVTNGLEKCLEILSNHDLIIVDELGYQSFDKQASNLFFGFVDVMYERTSVIVTSNKEFEKWYEVFDEAISSQAILDRLVHHAVIIAINGKSYRLKDKLKEK